MGFLKDILTRFRFQVDGDGKLKRATAAVREAEARMRSATREANAFTTSVSGIGSRLAGSLGVAAIGGLFAGVGVGVLHANTEFESLNAQLETVLGTSERAESAMAWIQNFAATTPFQIQEVTNAFLRLSKKGIEPTTETMTALGDLASSNARDIDTLLQGVSSLVSSGSTEVLEGATGLDWSVKGGKAYVTMLDGTKKAIDRNAQALTDFLVELGKSDGIAGGMAKQSATLGGRISNLKDSLWQLAVAIGQAGLSDLIKGVTEQVIKLAGAVQKWTADGDRVKRYLDIAVKGFKGLAAAWALWNVGKATVETVKFIGALQKMGTSALWTQAKMLLIPAAVALILLAIEDLVGFTQGKDSLFGRMLEAQGIDPEPIRERLLEVGETFEKAWEKISAAGEKIGAALSEAGDAILEALGADSWDVVIGATIAGLTEVVIFVIEAVAWLVEAFAWGIDFIEDNWDWLWKAVIGALAAPTAILLALPAAIAYGFYELVGWIQDNWDDIVAGAELAWEKLKGAFFDALYAIGEFIVDAGEVFVEIWDAIWDGIAAGATWLYDTIADIFSGIGDFFSGIFDSAITGLLSVLEGALNGLADLLGELPDFILDELPDALVTFANEGVDLTSSFGAAAPAPAAPAPVAAVAQLTSRRGRTVDLGGTDAADLVSGPIVEPKTQTNTNNVTMGAVTVQVNGTVDMNDAEMLEAIRSGAREVLQSEIEAVFDDVADTAEAF